MQTLFDNPPEPGLQQPRARRTDPDTSHEAAEEVTQGGTVDRQSKAAAEAVEAHPGCTSAELASFSTELDHWQFTRRLPDAERQGLVQRGESRKCEVKGRKMLTWWPVQDQPEK